LNEVGVDVVLDKTRLKEVFEPAGEWYDWIMENGSVEVSETGIPMNYMADQVEVLSIVVEGTIAELKAAAVQSVVTSGGCLESRRCLAAIQTEKPYYRSERETLAITNGIIICIPLKAIFTNAALRAAVTNHLIKQTDHSTD